MILMEEEFLERLEAYVDAYLLQKEALEKEGMKDKELTAIVLDYMHASEELRDFMTVAFDQDNPELPNMEVFFSNGKYHDFAYRIYAAVLESKQFPDGADWRTLLMVHTGKLLRVKCRMK